jgi:hypothetical protein
MVTDWMFARQRAIKMEKGARDHWGVQGFTVAARLAELIHELGHADSGATLGEFLLSGSENADAKALALQYLLQLVVVDPSETTICGGSAETEQQALIVRLQGRPLIRVVTITTPLGRTRIAARNAS